MNNVFAHALDGFNNVKNVKENDNMFKEIDSAFFSSFTNGISVKVLKDYRDMEVEEEDWGFDGEDEYSFSEIATKRFYSEDYSDRYIDVAFDWDNSNEKMMKFGFRFEEIDDTIWAEPVTSVLTQVVNSVGGYLLTTSLLGRHIDRIVFGEDVIVPADDNTGYRWENVKDHTKGKGDTLIEVIWECVFERQLKEPFTVYFK